MNYLEYEEKVRQDPDEHQKSILSFYLPFFRNCNKVLDLACGKGNFLELLEGRGVGVDRDKFICDYVRKKGLKIIHSDLMKFLENTKEVFDGIMFSHIIEHFSIKDVSRILKLMYKHLRKGGTLVIVTPNAESVTARLYFEKDPTHVRFYPHQLIRFLGEEAGFKFVKSGSNPHSRAKIWKNIELKELKNTNLNIDKFSKIFESESLKIKSEFNEAKKIINALIKKINMLEDFILNPMDAYVVMTK